MSEADLTAGSGGGVPIRALVEFDPTAAANDMTIDGQRFLRSGLIETDTSKFSLAIWKDMIGTLWRQIGECALFQGNRICVDMESNGAGNTYLALMDAYTAEDPIVCRSVDGGLNWTLAVLTSLNMMSKSFKSIAYGAGKWVLVGDGGKIATSTDGINFDLRASGTTSDLAKVKFNGSIFVAVGTTAILTSSDGITWVSRAFPAGMPGGSFYDLEFGNNTWVLVGPSNYLATGPADGSLWTQRFGIITAGYASMMFDPETSKFYHTGSGKAQSSPDGINWTLLTASYGSSSNYPYQKMAKLSGFFYWAEAGGVTRSKDFTSKAPMATTPAMLHGIYNWVKRLQNGHIIAVAFSTNSFKVYGVNTAPYAGSPLPVNLTPGITAHARIS